MAKETVQAVRQAELNALQKEKDALSKKETIISESEQKAKALISSMTKQAMEKAEYDLADAYQYGITLVEAAKAKALEESILLKNITEKKEKDAIQLIISCVIHDN